MNIDWKVFAERVVTGTRIRDQNCDGEIHREGILLEVYPHEQDEEISYYSKLETQNLLECPTLRVQWFPQMHRRDDYLAHRYPDDMQVYNMPMHQWLAFLVDGQWITLEQVTGYAPLDCHG